MRKPSTISLRNEDDNSDTFSNSAHASTQAYLEDVSPHDSYNKESEDSDCFSDSSKKIRKKRNAYQKISDEIRLKLLECVKNGETLKSAAKRFKINYSSAKSILHTFRKEGRILKKSAQERTTKKKSESLIDIEQTPKSARLIKKNSVNLPADKASRSMTSLNGKGAAGMFSRETTPAGSLTRLDEVTLANYEQPGQEQYVRGMSEEVAHEGCVHHDDRKMSYQDEASHQYNKMGYYMNYNDAHAQHYQQPYETGRNYMTEGVDHHQQQHHGNYTMGHGYPREYDTYNDMYSAMLHKPAQVDEYFTDSTAFLGQREQGHDLNEESGYNGQFNSFLDTQNIFRDALKKGSQVSYSNSNQAAFRKASIDLF